MKSKPIRIIIPRHYCFCHTPVTQLEMSGLLHQYAREAPFVIAKPRKTTTSISSFIHIGSVGIQEGQPSASLDKQPRFTKRWGCIGCTLQEIANSQLLVSTKLRGCFSNDFGVRASLRRLSSVHERRRNFAKVG